MLVDYSETSKAYIVYNYKTLTVEELIHVKFNDKKTDSDLLELDKSFTDMDIGASNDPDTPKGDKMPNEDQTDKLAFHDQ